MVLTDGSRAHFPNAVGRHPLVETAGLARDLRGTTLGLRLGGRGLAIKFESEVVLRCREVGLEPVRGKLCGVERDVDGPGFACSVHPVPAELLRVRELAGDREAVEA